MLVKNIALLFRLNSLMKIVEQNKFLAVNRLLQFLMVIIIINLESGKVYTFGKGAYNRLGLSTTQNVHTPTLVESLKNKKVKQISAGCRHGHCLTQ